MTWEQIADDWGRCRGFVKLHWAKVSEGQLDWVAGSRERLVEAIQAAYRMSRGNADRQLANWQDSQRESKHPG